MVDKRTPKQKRSDYETAKYHALEFGRSQKLEKVLFGTCNECNYYFSENIIPITGLDVDGEISYCPKSDCKGIVTQVHLKVQQKDN
tara:strand:+ start:439 stop:696 length:258 start_codon:yes stop_codon:yes gene_type:complete